MEMTSDPFNLERFVTAQDTAFDRVREEIRNGKRQSKWVEYVFPQLRGLGTSALSERYGLGGGAEAAAYLAHPKLGRRLNELTHLMLEHRFDTLRTILGFPDDHKFQSSMTLFAVAAGQDSIYGQALFTFCNGPDPVTLRMLVEKSRQLIA